MKPINLIISSLFFLFQSVVAHAWTPSSLDEAMNCLVSIRNDQTSGSGFIVLVDGKTYIYTNTHVASMGAFKVYDSQGNLIKDWYGIETVSNEGVDLSRLKLKKSRDHYLTLASSISPVGSQITALGDSLGENVHVSLEGTLKGAGTEEIEITCEIVPGNSGGPVLDKKSLHVIGVSTRVAKRDDWITENTDMAVRRFATRVDTTKDWKWIKTTSEKLYQADNAINHTFETTTVLESVLKFIPTDNGFQVPEIRTRGGSVLSESQYKLNPIMKSAYNISEKLSSARARGKTWSKGDLTKNYLKFYSYALSYASSDYKKTKKLSVSGYHKDRFVSLSKLQQEIASNYKKRMTAFKRNPRSIWVKY